MKIRERYWKAEKIVCWFVSKLLNWLVFLDKTGEATTCVALKMSRVLTLYASNSLSSDTLLHIYQQQERKTQHQKTNPATRLSPSNHRGR